MGTDTNLCNQQTELALDFEGLSQNEKRTLWVVLLTFSMMILEIFAGYWTGSMALLADGYHMASHAGALGLAYLVYKLAKVEKLKNKLTFGSGKLLPLGGYTSAIGLGIVALWMVSESIHRFLNPNEIQLNEAIFVAGLGLVVNIASAFLLGLGHHHGHNHNHNHNHNHDHESHAHERHHEHEVVTKPIIVDHNHRSALIHVVADALTSVLAIFALLAGKYYDAFWLDPMMGIVGAVVILRWAYTLCRDTAFELLDSHPQKIPTESLRAAIESDGARVVDFHVWKVGPANYAWQLVVESDVKKGSDYYRQYIPKGIGAVHLVVEER